MGIDKDISIRELVNFLNRLDRQNVIEAYRGSRASIDSVVQEVFGHDSVKFEKLAERCRDSSRAMDTEVQNIMECMGQARAAALKAISKREPDRIAQDQERYRTQGKLETEDLIGRRVLRSSEKDRQLWISRILDRTKTMLPGAIIRPCSHDWMFHMVSQDPLYLVDQRIALITPVIHRYNERYQRRLRPNLINEDLPGQMLKDLPDSQFNIIISWAFFNWKPLPLTLMYLGELAVKLRPGGRLMFTFNDCDHEHFVGLSDSGYMHYQPARLLIAHAQSLGLEVTHQHRGEQDVAWLELQRLGKISTIRDGQNLAKIIEKSK